MSSGLSGRAAIVVGVGAEFGRATAGALAGSGYTVGGVDRNEQGLNELPGDHPSMVQPGSLAAPSRALPRRVASLIIRDSAPLATQPGPVAHPFLTRFVTARNHPPGVNARRPPE
jgi:NAD(P)-dependent dehydrogenase (short-subunit alcohol dehydrogenase family)